MNVMTADDVAAKQISALEARRYQAMTDGDLGALEELFSPDLVYTHSDASSDSKKSYLAKLASTRKAASWCAATAPSSSATCAARC
jgi:ketosteroid isomerase-like protein